MKKTIAYLPLALIGIGILVLYLSGFYHDLNFHIIQQKHLEWKAYIHFHPYLAALMFVGIYIASVCLIIPDSTLLSIIGGFLFPLPLAIFYIVFSETVGALLFFWATKAAFVHGKVSKKYARFNRLEEKVHEHPVSYLLFFRFSHLLPFWVINAASAIFQIRTTTFLWTTVIGLVPLAIVLAQGGAELSVYFESHTSFSIEDIFDTHVKILLICLGALALLPIFFKRKRRFWKF